jgi:hypothetical protein
VRLPQDEIRGFGFVDCYREQLHGGPRSVACERC